MDWLHALADIGFDLDINVSFLFSPQGGEASRARLF